MNETGRRRDGDELPHDLPQHPDGVDGVPTNDGFQGSGYHPDSEMQVLVDTPPRDFHHERTDG
jgi:hypothetical protein